MLNCASSAATIRSQASASWNPAPTAWPRTAAIETNDGSASQVNPLWKPAISSSATESGARARNVSGESGPPVKAERSRPAEKDGPVPVRTTTRTPSVMREPMCANAIPGGRELRVAYLRGDQG